MEGRVMIDNKFWIVFWLGIFTVISFVIYLTYEYNMKYNEKIVSIQRYEYFIRIPDGRRIPFTLDVLEKNE